MGYPSPTQPLGLTINSTGQINFNTATLGYWNVQIKVSDGLAYVVVDFMIFVTVCLQSSNFNIVTNIVNRSALLTSLV